MTARGWAADAAERVARAWAAAARPWSVRAGGFWATARTSYAPRPLPPAFRIEEVRAAGARRRLALAEGRGRPLLILPGLYADVDEGLFSELAGLAARAGRTVALLEDRFAAGTLALNRDEVPTLPQLALEAAAVAARLPDGPPDALALSAGCAAALAAPTGTFHHLAAFSAALDPRATRAHLRRSPLLHLYYGRVHRRAWREAGLRPPGLPALLERLGSPAPAPTRADPPALLVHARNDPVSPPAVAQRAAHRGGHVFRLLPGGGHLGFGVVAGTAFYLVPFEDG